MARKLIIDDYSDLNNVTNGDYFLEYFPETDNLWILDDFTNEVICEISCIDNDADEVSEQLECFRFDPIEFNNTHDKEDIEKMIHNIYDYIQVQKGIIGNLQHEINELETEIAFDSSKALIYEEME